jgi:alpha-galactosidase
MVIDDGWQGSLTTDNTTGINDKFYNIKSLADDLHAKGLKLGIYSSPGPKSCGGLLTSYKHEREDAQQWAKWGVDYVKYDWCSYNDVLAGKKQNEWSVAEQLAPFKLMCDELNATKRDILFSVCNWGMNDVWKWAHQSGGQLWRTTGDIEDSWASLSTIGLSQPDLAAYAKKSGWNDPDMLIVGWVGWGDKLHQTHLTPAEQYTHISMWSMLAAPMMIGCDVSRLDAFTYNLLANDEINAINQDVLGNVAKVTYKDAEKQVWVKDLADGHKAVAIFNLKNEKLQLKETFGFSKNSKVRDVWRKSDTKLKKLLKTELLPHGCVVFLVPPQVGK